MIELLSPAAMFARMELPERPPVAQTTTYLD